MKKTKEPTEKSRLEKGHEPWPEKEQKVMQLGIDQLIQKRDKMRQELLTEKAGLENIDTEIQVNIDQAAMAVKAANMSLAALLFDQKCDITISQHKNRVVELEHEIERTNHNVVVFQKQLDEGRPKRKEPKHVPQEVERTKEELEELQKKAKEAGKNAGQSKEEKAGQATSKPDTKA